MNEAKQRIEDAWNNAKAFLEGINLKQIGRDIIQGLINGIKEKVTAVGRAVSDVTSEITGKVKSILGISSPSRVLAQFGKWTVEGLAKGITDSLRVVDRASERMADAVIPSRREIDLSYATPSGIQSSLAGAVSGTVDVHNRSEERIASAVERLERKIENMRIEMDRREVGRLVADPVTEVQERRRRVINRSRD